MPNRPLNLFFMYSLIPIFIVISFSDLGREFPLVLIIASRHRYRGLPRIEYQVFKCCIKSLRLPKKPQPCYMDP